MRFGKTLRNAINPAWKDKYVEYAKLKSLLREDSEDDSRWTEDDENKFCDEILNVQLEKVAEFQASTFRSLEARTNKAAEKLQELAPIAEDGEAQASTAPTAKFKEIEGELDDIINQTKELKKYSNINYTAFLKIVKKHDRRRGSNYKIRPMLLLSLSKRPFNSEQDYSPLLNKLSMMYYAVRQQLERSDPSPAASTDAQSQTQNGEKYYAHKCRSSLADCGTFLIVE